MTLDAEIRVAREGFALDAHVTAADGEVLAVVGPNGSGKSTLLHALAGLVPADGEVRIDAVDLARLAPDERAVGWVPQDGALFPHLTARDNVAFGLGGRRARPAAEAWLGRLGIADLAGRKPAQLSGGQAQKVALARALARQPRLLLLDEPLTALDVTARADVRRTLRRHLDEFDGVTLLVTHDAVDTVTLADRVIALDAGRVVQDAAPATVTREPRSAWLAELMGSNAFAGRSAGAVVELAAGGSITVAGPLPPDGTDVLGVVPAHAVSLHRDRPHGSARNAWPVVVGEISALGSRVRIECTGTPSVVAEVTPAAVAELRIAEGDEVWAVVKATEVTVVLL